MTSVNAIRDTYRLEASAVGVAETTAAAEKLAKGTDAVTASSEKQERRVLSVEKALERFAAANDKAFRTQQVLARGQAILDRAQEQGLRGSVAFERATAALAEKQALLARSATMAAAANDNLAASYTAQSGLLSGLASGYGKLVGLVTTLGAAYAAAEFVRTVTSFQAIENSLRAATGSTEAARSAMAFVRAESERLGLSLTATAKDFTSFAAATRGTELEGQNTRKIFSAVAEAGTVLGLSAETMSGALLALTQMASKGTVASEELRGQLGERLPGAFNIAARAMGVTTAELGKMLDTGQLMAADFLPKFADELHKSFGPEAAKAADNLQANINRLGTAITDLYLAAGKGGLTDALNAATKQATAFLKANMDTATSVGGTLATALRFGGQAFDFLRRNADLAGAALAALLALRYGPALVEIAAGAARAAASMAVYSVETRGLGGQPAGTVTCDVRGDASSGLYTDTTAGLVRRLATVAAGLADPAGLNTASFQAVDAAQPSSVGYWLDGGTDRSVADVIADLMGGVGGWGGVRRDGRLEVGIFTAPDGTVPAARYDRVDIVEITRDKLPSDLSPPPWRWRIAYGRNYTVQTDVEGRAGVTAARAAFLKEATRLVASDATNGARIRANHPLAQDPAEIQSYFVDAAAAQAEADRLLALYGTARSLYRITLKILPFAHEIGDVVFVTYPRWDLTAGRLLRIVAITDDTDEDRVEIVGFG